MLIGPVYMKRIISHVTFGSSALYPIERVGSAKCIEIRSRAWSGRVAVISAEIYKCQRRKRQSVTAKREKSQTPKVLSAILTLPNLT